MNDNTCFRPNPLAMLRSQLNRPAWIWLALLAVALVLSLSISPNQRWDGDGELYILNALNILNQDDYSVTNYQVNPSHAIHPAAYPPGLPLLLVPVLDAFGIHYQTIKLALVICYILTLVVIMKITESFLEVPWRLFILLALGLNPLVFGFKNYVFSEFPFMMFVYLALYAFDRMSQALENGAPRAASLLWAGVSGLAMAAAYETRTIGIVLFASVGAYTLLNFRHFRLFGSAVLLIGLAATALTSRLFPADVGTYASYFEVNSISDLGKIAHNIADAGRSYLSGLADLLGRSSYPIIRIHNSMMSIVTYAVIALAIAGFLIRLRRGITIYEVFFTIFMATLCVYPIYYETQRYALPVFPLMLIYAVVAVTHRAPWYPALLRYRGMALVAVFVFLYGWQYAWGPRKAPVPSVDGQEAMALYDQIRLHAAPDEVVLCAKPTIIALHAQRPSTNWPLKPDPGEFLDFVEETNAKWLLIIGPPLFYSRGDTLVDLLPEIRHRIEPAWSSTHFSLYRII